MTITAKTTITAPRPPKRSTKFTSTLEDGTTISALQYGKGVEIQDSDSVNYIRNEYIDSYIELLFAVKADHAAAAEFEAKWLAEQAEVDIHTEVSA